jgi:hypothetical protein
MIAVEAAITQRGEAIEVSWAVIGVTTRFVQNCTLRHQGSA